MHALQQHHNLQHHHPQQPFHLLLALCQTRGGHGSFPPKATFSLIPTIFYLKTSFIISFLLQESKNIIKHLLCIDHELSQHSLSLHTDLSDIAWIPPSPSLTRLYCQNSLKITTDPSSFPASSTPEQLPTDMKKVTSRRAPFL